MELVPRSRDAIHRDAVRRDVQAQQLHRHVRQATLERQRRRHSLPLRPQSLPHTGTDVVMVAGESHLWND